MLRERSYTFSRQNRCLNDEKRVFFQHFQLMKWFGTHFISTVWQSHECEWNYHCQKGIVKMLLFSLCLCVCWVMWVKLLLSSKCDCDDCQTKLLLYAILSGNRKIEMTMTDDILHFFLPFHDVLLEFWHLMKHLRTIPAKPDRSKGD